MWICNPVICALGGNPWHSQVSALASNNLGSVSGSFAKSGKETGALGIWDGQVGTKVLNSPLSGGNILEVAQCCPGTDPQLEAVRDVGLRYLKRSVGTTA